MPSKETNFYTRLGLANDASPEEIRRAYRESARRLHPDKNTEPGETELFLDVQEAFEVLSDPTKRSAYDANLPAGEVARPVVINATFSRATLHRTDEPQLVYILLELTPQKEHTKKFASTPLNVCLVIDCSTSMQGLLMDTVKSTAIELVRQLKQDDILSIVAFSDRAEVILPAGKRLDTGQIEAGIQMLHSKGGTEIFRGLEAGYSEVCRFRDANHTNHIILITDGRTYGDEADCVRIAHQSAIHGVGISSFGIGDKWNDQFLDNLASLTGGNTLYVTTPKDIRDYLKDKIKGLGQCYAENVTYHFEIASKAHLRYAFRLQPDASPIGTDSPIHFGSIPRDDSLIVLMEFLVETVPPRTDQYSLAEGRVTMDVPFRSSSQFATRLELNRLASDEPDSDPPPSEIVQAMSRLTLYRMQERARQDVAEGKIKQATRQLQNIATHLLAQGNPELARTIFAEIGHIQKNQSFSESGEKRIKYGTRGLLLPAEVLEDKPT